MTSIALHGCSPTLKISNATLSYGTTPILTNINLICTPGTITAILGSNGTGKSTLLKACAGLLPLTAGTRVCTSQNIGYVPEQCALPTWLTAYDALWYAVSFMDKKIISNQIINALELVNLKQHAHKKINRFSKGMKQRLAFAEIILCNPPVILLDEPFSGLDMPSKEIIERLIFEFKEQNKTIVCSAHSANEIAADNYLTLKS